jgi:lipopolysaccharide/colanic/teichoic acid biosynthesis glycosyltransferase
MSLVGPRPHAVAHNNEYDKLIANYALRNHVNPGITYRGETPTTDLMQQRVAHDYGIFTTRACGWISRFCFVH